MARPKAGSASKKASKKMKKVKDKNAPKKPTTAFFFFVKHRRSQKADQGMKVSEFTSECGTMWRKLEDDDKKKFEKLAVADRERYQKEMAAYKPDSVVDPNEPVKPKRPNTPFLIFANAKRPELLADGYSAKEVLQEAGRLWKEMDGNEKDEFNSLAAEEKKKYEKEMARYNEELKSYKKNGAPKKAAKKAESEEEEEEEEDDEEEEDMDSDDE